jgi:hypothetical protein
MAIHSRRARMLALVGVLALGGASALQAQQTTNAPKDTSAARSDTSGYQSYQNQADSTRDSSGFKYTGPATDTTLKAAPGAQTGPTAGDSMGKMGADSGSMGKMSGAGTSDTVVCKDGSNAAGGESGCSAHGGIDSVATTAAMKARGSTEKSDTTKSQKQSP